MSPTTVTRNVPMDIGVPPARPLRGLLEVTRIDTKKPVDI